MLDNAQLLRNGISWDLTHYAQAWIENTNNYSDAIESLEGRYATDSNYDTKIDNIIDEYDLTQYDFEETKAPEPTETGTSSHQVNANDTLCNISTLYGVTVTELQELNNLNSNRVQKEESLQVRGDAQAPQNTTSHTVSTNDTLYSIANRYGMSVSALQRLNGLTTNRIQNGQTFEVKENQQATQSSKTHTVAPGDTRYNISN